MIINQYSVKDIVAEEFGQLFSAKNDGTAIRQFNVILKNCLKKDDFELWCLCSFDTESGQLELSFNPYKVAIAEEVEDVDNQN